MEPRISLVTLGVRDVAASRRFYETLGWRASPSSNAEVAFFQLGGMALALFGRQALAADAQVEDGTGFGGTSLAQNQVSRDTNPEIGTRRLLGRVFGILRRSRRTCLGDRLESLLHARGRWPPDTALRTRTRR